MLTKIANNRPLDHEEERVVDLLRRRGWLKEKEEKNQELKLSNLGRIMRMTGFPSTTRNIKGSEILQIVLVVFFVLILTFLLIAKAS